MQWETIYQLEVAVAPSINESQGFFSGMQLLSFPPSTLPTFLGSGDPSQIIISLTYCIIKRRGKRREGKGEREGGRGKGKRGERGGKVRGKGRGRAIIGIIILCYWSLPPTLPAVRPAI